MTECPCVCHGHGSAYAPACDVAGGCGHLHRDERTGCVLDHSRDEEAPLKWIGDLCRWHRGRLDFLTREISDNFINLALILEAGSAPKDSTPKTRHMKSASPPAPVNLDVIVLRDPRTTAGELRHILKADGLPADLSRPSTSVVTTVADLMVMVAEDRPFRFADLPRSVIGQLDLMTRHHDWIAAQPWIEHYFTELTDLRRAINGALRDKHSEHVGRCYLDTDSGETCNGTLSRKLGTESVRCSKNRAHTWVTPAELARLEMALHGARTA